MEDFDYSGPWYHGSPERLTALRKGSMVIPFKEVAKAFSHKPSMLSMGDDFENVKHNGRAIGHLYEVAETVGPDDLCCLEGTAQTHWQTQRDLQLRHLVVLPLDDPPQLTEEEIANNRKANPERKTGFFGDPDPT